jgi:hypothetical protein
MNLDNRIANVSVQRAVSSVLAKADELPGRLQQYAEILNRPRFSWRAAGLMQVWRLIRMGLMESDLREAAWQLAYLQVVVLEQRRMLDLETEARSGIPPKKR